MLCGHKAHRWCNRHVHAKCPYTQAFVLEEKSGDFKRLLYCPKLGGFRALCLLVLASAKSFPSLSKEASHC